MTTYTEIIPTSQDDLLKKVEDMFKLCAFKDLSLLTLINSGMGSGKSNIMATLPVILPRFYGIVIVLEKNIHLRIQIMKAFRKSKMINKMVLIDNLDDKVINKIQQAISACIIPVVFLKHVAHIHGSLNPSAKILEKLVGHPQLSTIKKLALIDELDSQLTSLCGGINAKLDHTVGIMGEYTRVAAQENSLNTFDILRKYEVKAFGFSGTMNNLICSKLPSLGYKAETIQVVNVYPIVTLYENLKIIPTNVNDFATIVPYLEAAEKKDNEKVLVVVSKKILISEFKINYHTYLKRPISSVEITGENEGERITPEWNEAFKNAKYVFGVNLVTTGFDLSTWVEGKEFSLGILYRTLSDTISQPLSKNKEHTLHMDTAAPLMQLLARLRKGGIFLVPYKLDERPLYDRLAEVFDHIKNGVNEYNWIGGIPGVSQAERHHQSLVIALIQNLKSNNRPIVEGILNDLKNMTDRDFEHEMKTHLDTPSSFDHVFWTGWIGCLWKTYQVNHESFFSEEDKIAKKADIIENYRRRLITTSGGIRNERVIDERIKEEIIKRSENTCGHCGDKFDSTDVPQDCHIKRHDNKGEYAMNNIIRGHSGCDSQYDSEGLIIYEISGKGVFLRKRVMSYAPHRKQLEGISTDNFRARWNWEKNRQAQSDISDGEFIEYLKEKGYIFKEY